LRLAYATLVRVATKAAEPHSSDDGSSSDALAWYCMDLTHSTLLASAREGDSARAQRLRRAFIAGVPGLSPILTPRALHLLNGLVDELPEGGNERSEILQVIHEELLQNTTDLQKDYVIKWWHKYRREWTKASALTPAGSNPDA
jgi:hypothetical protein